MRNRFLYPLLFLGLIGFLAVPRPVRGNVATGGLSRIRTEGVLISVEGGSITEVGDHKLHIRALSLSPRLILDATPITTGGVPGEGEETTEPAGLPAVSDINPPTEDAAPKESAQAPPNPSSQTLELRLTNLNPRWITVEGETQWQPKEREVLLRVELAPGEIKTLQLQTVYPDPDSFSFAVMGDSAGGDRIFGAILKRLNETKPLFAVNCGDLINNGRRGEYRQFIRLIRPFRYPLFFAVGNHDIMWWGRMVYQEYFGPTYYSFDFRQAHFIFLDNALGRIDDHQFRWLEQDLQHNTKTYTFMFMHLPPFDPRPDKYNSMNSQANAQYLMDLAARYGVDRVFCGHIHEYHREERDGVVYIISGGAGSGLQTAEAFHHYLLITVSQQGITEEVIKLD
jgi:predicted phosphodiesterase